MPLIGEQGHCTRRLSREPHVNLEAQNEEIWIHDPDGFVVVLGGPTANLKLVDAQSFWTR